MTHAITDTLRIALAQLNPLSATSPATPPSCARRAREAAAKGADLVVFTELFITGYPPEDLVRKPAFAAAAAHGVEALAPRPPTAAPA